MAVLIFLGCGSKIESRKTLVQDEYDVFTSIINSQFGYVLNSPKGVMHDDTIFIYYKTIPGEMFGERAYSHYSPKQSDGDSAVSLKWFSTSGEWDTLVTNFKFYLKDTVNIERSKLVIPFNYLLFYQGNTLIDKKVICFSRVGFNVSRNEALVFISYGEFEGGGSFTLLLRKTDNQWKIIEGYGRHMGMISGFDYYNIRPRYPLRTAP